MNILARLAVLKVGDEIVSIDGKSAQQVALYELREEFKGAVGTHFTLRVKGSQGDERAERTVVLRLADQI